MPHRVCRLPPFPGRLSCPLPAALSTHRSMGAARGSRAGGPSRIGPRPRGLGPGISEWAGWSHHALPAHLTLPCAQGRCPELLRHVPGAGRLRVPAQPQTPRVLRLTPLPHSQQTHCPAGTGPGAPRTQTGRKTGLWALPPSSCVHLSVHLSVPQLVPSSVTGEGSSRERAARQGALSHSRWEHQRALPELSAVVREVVSLKWPGMSGD